MKSTISRVCLVFCLTTVLLVCFSNLGYPSAAIPSAIEEVDTWWQVRLKEKTIPTTADLSAVDPDSPATIRLLDHVLMYLVENRRDFDLQQTLKEAGNGPKGSLFALWGEAWNGWLYPLPSLCSRGKNSTINALSSVTPAQIESLKILVSRYPTEMTGAVAVRLLVLHAGNEAFSSGQSLYDTAALIEKDNPTGSSFAVILMYRGLASASRNDWETASREWLKGMKEYPFRAETYFWCLKISEALSRLDDKTREDVLNNRSEDKELTDLIRQYLSLLRSRELSEAGKYQDSSDLLSGILKEVNAYRCRSAAWRELLADVALELETTHRKAGQSTPGESFLEKLRLSENTEFTQTLSAGLAEFGSDIRFAIGAFLATGERAGKSSKLTEPSWRSIASAEGADPKVRALAYIELIKTAYNNLVMIRKMPVIESPGGLSLASSTQDRAAKQEESLLSTLEDGEDFVRSAPLSSEMFDLCELLCITYSALDVRNLPKDLYVGIAKDQTNQDRRETADRAEMIGRKTETIAILRLVLDDDAPGGGKTDPRIRLDVLSRLLVLLSDQELYSEAVTVSKELIEKQDGNPAQQNADWYNTSVLYYKDKQYKEAHEILERILADPNTQPETVIRIEKLLSLVEYKLGKYKDSLALMEKLKAEGRLEKSEEQRMLLIRAYTALYTQNYQEALADFSYLLENHRSILTTEELDQIQRMVSQMKGIKK